MSTPLYQPPTKESTHMIPRHRLFIEIPRECRQMIYGANQISKCIDNLADYPDNAILNTIRCELTVKWAVLVATISVATKIPQSTLDGYIIEPMWPLPPRAATPPATSLGEAP
jgi:hypothetical protein